MKSDVAIGLTGSICTGKSAAEKHFGQYFQVIDADRVVHELYDKDQELIDQIFLEFGSSIVQDNKVMRKSLGKLVFEDALKLKKLVHLVHPKVTQYLLKKIDECRANNTICIFSIPLLFENSWEKSLDQTIVITCDEKIQLQRIQKRDHKNESEALLVIQHQMAQDEKVKKADYFIENNHSLDFFHKKIDKVLLEMGLKINS
ncbi:dephospho-CoA kinase [bacterium]|nr:dephospho-CoA kinase [bacterium]